MLPYFYLIDYNHKSYTNYDKPPPPNSLNDILSGTLLNHLSKGSVFKETMSLEINRHSNFLRKTSAKEDRRTVVEQHKINRKLVLNL